jgi:hypothetical protein
VSESSFWLALNEGDLSNDRVGRGRLRQVVGMMNGVVAQTRRFQAAATINGVPYNKMIVSPVRSNVCLSRFDLICSVGPLGDPERKYRIAALRQGLQELGWVDGSKAKISAL